MCIRDSSTLDATDALKRKLDAIPQGSDFLLSWEQFTTDEGQLRNYWKAEPVSKESANPVFDNVKKSVNEFDQKLQADKEVKQAVETTNQGYSNPARMGMIFNNTIKLYIANDMSWTTDEFVSNFKRVESWVEACEDKPGTPVASNLEKLQEQRIDANTPSEAVEIKADDLPF